MATQLGLHDLFVQVRSIAYGIWRKRWYMMVATWIVCIVGWGLVQSMPYRYASSAQIFVDTDAILPSLIKRIGGSSSKKKLDVVRTTLVADSNLVKIIRRSDLDRFAQTDAELQAIMSVMKDDINVISMANSIFRIEYENGDGRLSERERAKLTKRVVSSLLSIFMEGNVQEGANKIQNAAVVIQEQLQIKSKELDDSERALATFRQQNVNYLGGQRGFITKLNRAKADLKGTYDELAELKVTLAQTKKQQENVPKYIVEAASVNSGSGRGSSETGLDKRISELEKKYDQLKTFGLKDKHPDVINVKTQLDELRKQKKVEAEEIQKEIEAVEGGRGGSSGRVNRTPNRLYEQLTLERFDKERSIISLEQRVKDQTSQVSLMEANAKRVPEIEAEEKGLVRDYNIIKERYDGLYKQNEDLKFTDVVDQRDDAMSYRIINEPVEPARPSGPNRLLLLTASLVGGLIVGLGVALLLSQLRPVVLSVEHLRERFDLPVLGNVTIMLSDEDQALKRKDMLMFGGMGAGLFAVYFTLILLDMVG